MLLAVSITFVYSIKAAIINELTLDCMYKAQWNTRI